MQCTTIQSESSFVRSTVRCGIFVSRCNSIIGKNVVLFCSHFKWQFNDFVCGNVSLNNHEFLHNFYSRVGNDDRSDAQLLAEILRIRMMILEYSLMMAEGIDIEKPGKCKQS